MRSRRMGGDNEHHIQCMAFEILRSFIAHPCDFQAIERAKDDPFALGRLVLQLEMLPALNRNDDQPFSCSMTSAIGLAGLGQRPTWPIQTAPRLSVRQPNRTRFILRILYKRISKASGFSIGSASNLNCHVSGMALDYSGPPK